MYFDARSAKQLKPGEHLLVPGCAGLRLDASSSRKAWTYRYKSLADGRMKQVGIGAWPTMSVQEAVGKWRELSEQRAAGTDPVRSRREQREALRRTAQTPPTVRQLIEAFIKGPLAESRKPAGLAAAKSALTRLLEEEPVFAACPAHEVSRAMAFGVIDARRSVPTAAAKLRSLLGATWSYAQDSGKLGDAPNWWREVLRGKLRSKGKIMGGEHVGRQRKVLSFVEVKALLAWLPNMHQNAQDAITLYLWTAMRGVEILGARADQFTIENEVMWWTVKKQFTKNARYADAVDLRVPLFGRAEQIIRRRKESIGQSGWLFEDVHGKQYTQHDLSTYVYDLQPYSSKTQERPGRLVLPVSGWTPHNLRKTARTFLAQLGCPNEIGEAIVGHMPAEIVGTYNAYSYDAERMTWLKRLSNYLESASADALPARPKPLAATGNNSEMGRSLPHAVNSSTSHAVRPLLS